MPRFDFCQKGVLCFWLVSESVRPFIHPCVRPTQQNYTVGFWIFLCGKYYRLKLVCHQCLLDLVKNGPTDHWSKLAIVIVRPPWYFCGLHSSVTSRDRLLICFVWIVYRLKLCVSKCFIWFGQKLADWPIVKVGDYDCPSTLKLCIHSTVQSVSLPNRCICAPMVTPCWTSICKIFF